MSKVIEIKGCLTCPNCYHTDDWDSFYGMRCRENKSISWTVDEFLMLDPNFIDERCPLEDMRRKIINETTEWMNTNAILFARIDASGSPVVSVRNMVNSYKRAMEEE